MRRMMTCLCAAAVGCATLLVGCDREVASSESVKVTDDSVKTKKTRVTESPDGSLHKTETETKREVHD